VTAPPYRIYKRFIHSRGTHYQSNLNTLTMGGDGTYNFHGYISATLTSNVSQFASMRGTHYLVHNDNAAAGYVHCPPADGADCLEYRMTQGGGSVGGKYFNLAAGNTQSNQEDLIFEICDVAGLTNPGEFNSQHTHSTNPETPWVFTRMLLIPAEDGASISLVEPLGAYPTPLTRIYYDHCTIGAPETQGMYNLAHDGDTNPDPTDDRFRFTNGIAYHWNGTGHFLYQVATLSAPNRAAFADSALPSEQKRNILIGFADPASKTTYGVGWDFESAEGAPDVILEANNKVGIVGSAVDPFVGKPSPLVNGRTRVFGESFGLTGASHVLKLENIRRAIAAGMAVETGLANPLFTSNPYFVSGVNSTTHRDFILDAWTPNEVARGYALGGTDVGAVSLSGGPPPVDPGGAASGVNRLRRNRRARKPRGRRR
jgi:hypothetical protein